MHIVASQKREFQNSFGRLCFDDYDIFIFVLHDALF
jgi:hypothetical protein